ncbi:MAG TPA: hypothetical protein VFK82_07610 [Burkholderiaceae bacterium]|nr:hypothetical protein [Burkholderiaceae bacterium]
MNNYIRGWETSGAAQASRLLDVEALLLCELMDMHRLESSDDAPQRLISR